MQESEPNYKKYFKLVSSRRYLFVTTTLIVVTVMTGYSFTLPKMYSATCTVAYQRNVISDVVKGISLGPSVEDRFKVLSYELKSRNLLLKVIADLKLDRNIKSNEQLDGLVKDLQRRTDIKLKDAEGTFTVSFQDRNPRMTREFINALISRYDTESAQTIKHESAIASRFLKEQINEYKQRLERTETKIVTFKTQNANLLALSEGQLQNEIEAAYRTLTDNRIKKNQLENLKHQVHQENPLQIKANAIQAKIDDLRARYTDNFPEVLSLKEEMAYLTKQLSKGSAKAVQPVQNTPEYLKLALELQAIDESDRNQGRLIAEKESLLRSLPAMRTSYEEMERERNNLRQLYEQFLVRQGQSEITKQVEDHEISTSFKIIEPAMAPRKPFSPNRPKIIMVGLFAGIASAFGLILALDYLKDTVTGIDSLAQNAVTVLAVVPKIETNDAKVTTKLKDLCFFTVSGCYLLAILTVLYSEVVQESSRESIDIMTFISLLRSYLQTL